MEPTLQEKLKTVAEFMGWEHLPSYDKFCANTIKDNPHFATTEMRFHTDYNWLMEAWVKFRDLEKTDLPRIKKRYVTFMKHLNAVYHAIPTKTISEAFDCLYEAIVWYNSLKK